MSRLGKRQLHEIYHYLKLNRRLEEELARLYRQGKLVGELYLGTGQEAVSVGSAYALRAGDFLAPAIRNIGSLLVRGFRPFEVFNQFMGKGRSPTRGRDGALHLGDLERGVVSPISQLGAHVAVMAGVAFAAKVQAKPAVALTYVGDGAIATGDFHEGLNFAAVHRLPLVVVLENNQYAFSARTSDLYGTGELYERFKGYGLPSLPVDGNDVLQVLQVTEAAVERARSGKGATLIEARTFRMGGHALHDDMSYVPAGLREEWKGKDPIARYEDFLSANGLLQPEERERITERIEQVVGQDLHLADQEPFPGPGSLREGVYHQAAPAQPELA